jgi:hypothetical protein
MITRPEESYRVWCVWVWSWLLDNEDASAQWGVLRQGKQKLKVIFFVEFLANILLQSYFVVGSNIFPITMFLDEFAKLRKAIISFVMSVRLSTWNNSAATGRILMKFCIWIFVENLSSIFKFLENRTRIKSTLHEDLCTFLIISRPILLRMKNVSEKNL